MKVVMVGTGYVGLVSGTCLADVGHSVVCVDNNPEKVATLLDGKCPIFEPGLESLIQTNVGHERLSFTTDLQTSLAGAEVVFIAVGTPEGEDGSADLGYVKAVATSLGAMATHSFLVVVKSTVPVGTCDIVEDIIQQNLEKRKVDFSIRVASNPEFLKEGDAVADFMKPDRIVVGLADAGDEALMRELYNPFIMDDPSRLLIMDRRSSELTKYGANAMLATRISFMNELAQLCEKLGANIDNIRRGIGADPRIGRKFLYAGPGYGGSCFPKDVAALLKTGEANQVNFFVLKAVTEANQRQKEFVAQKIKRHFGDLKGKTIAVWGLAFKPGTDDVREAPAMTIIDLLLKWGAQVVAHDPEALETFSRQYGPRTGLRYADDAYEALQGADALVLVTEWREYKRPNWQKIATLMRTRAVFDLRNQYEAEKLQKGGFHYEGVGRPI